MRILAHGGSTPEHPVESYEQIPPGGYGDGYGGYGTYGAYGKGWHPVYGTNGRWKDDIGYGPLQHRPHSRSPYSHHAGTYGAKDGKDSNIYIVQAPMGKGSSYIYPIRHGKGGGKKGEPSEQELQDAGDGGSYGSSRSPMIRHLGGRQGGSSEKNSADPDPDSSRQPQPKRRRKNQPALVPSRGHDPRCELRASTRRSRRQR